MKAREFLSLKEEFHSSSLSLSSIPHHCSSTSRLFKNQKVFLAYRFIMMTYTVITTGFTFRGFAHALPPKRPWPVWLTNWSYLLGTLHFVFAFFILLITQTRPTHKSQQNKIENLSRVDQKCSKPEKTSLKLERRCSKTEKTPPEVIANLTLLNQLDWLCFTVACTLSLLVSFIFFVALYPQKKIDFIPPGDLITHLFNSLIMLLDLVICSLPIRLSHLLYVMLAGLAYLSFSVLHWLQGPPNNFLYKGILDWNQPRQTLAASAVICVLLLPLMHVFNFALFRIKSSILVKLTTSNKTKTKPEQ